MVFIPKINEFNDKGLLNSRQNFQNLIFIFVTVCLCALTLLQILGGKRLGDVSAITYNQYMFAIMMGEDSNYDLSTVTYCGAAKWETGTDEFNLTGSGVYEGFESYKSDNVWVADIGYQYMGYDYRSSVTIDFEKINALTGNKIVEIYAYDSSGNKCLSITNSVTLDKNVTEEDYGWTTVGYQMDGYYRFCTLYVEWKPALEIGYYDCGATEFSGTHEGSYNKKHINGFETTLDTPTRTGYIFDGWYLNDSTCSDATCKVMVLSADVTYTTINLYAKWIALNLTFTLTCDNFGNQQYMIYIYSGENLIVSFAPTKKIEIIKLTAPENYEISPYKVCFVFGYFGSITFENLTNAIPSGRNVKIPSFGDASIAYKIATPQINSTIII